MQTKIFDYPITRLIRKNPFGFTPGYKYCLSYKYWVDEEDRGSTLYVFVFVGMLITTNGTTLVEMKRSKCDSDDTMVADTLNIGNFNDSSIDVCKVSPDFPNVWSQSVKGFRV